MKKTLYILLLLTVVIFYGCGNSANTSASDLHDFDSSDLKKELSNNFNAELPTKLPIKVEKTTVDVLPSQKNVLNINFEGKESKMQLQIVKGENKSSGSNKGEKVKVKNIEGQYIVNDNQTKILKWKKDNISYSLIYFSNQSKQEVDKKDLINSAESFVE